MKFNDALKDTAVGGEVNGVLLRTARLFPCAVCRNVTGWRKVYPDCPGVPVCSDECLDLLHEQEKPVEEPQAQIA